MPAPTSTTRVALYTRVSTDRQANLEEGSLDTQEARLRKYIESREGAFEIRHAFREEGASGKSLDRPRLQEMMRVVEADDIDLVVVTRIDRLSRSLLDFYELNRLFEKHGVRFASLNESFDTSTLIGRTMLKLVLIFAEMEREQIAERTRIAARARAERGLWIGGRTPLGYDSDGHGHLTVNPAEAELVKLIYHRYLETKSTPRLAAWLNEHGHRQKQFVSRRKGPSGGAPFTPGSVLLTLRNPLYLGEIKHRDDTFTGQHPAIIDRETFERVQAVIAGNVVNRHSPPARIQYDYLLTGLLQCSCGYALTTSSGTGRLQSYPYYRCSGLNKQAKHTCGVRNIRAETVDQAVLSVVRETARDPKLLAAAVEEANRMAREQVHPLRDRVVQVKRELAEAEDRAEATLLQILSAGVGASSTAKRMLNDAEVRINQLREALAEAEGQLAVQETEQMDLEVMVNAIRSFDVAFDHLTLAEKREFLGLMVKQVTIHPDHVVVDLYEGRQATRFLETTKKRVPGDPGGVPGGSEGREQPGEGGESPDPQSRFVDGTVWHAFPYQTNSIQTSP